MRTLISYLFLVISIPLAWCQDVPWSQSTSPAWGDFQGTPPPLLPPPAENYDAFTYTEILWDFTWDPATKTLTVNVQAAFLQQQCWVRPSAASAALLTHELGHFDYTEVHARTLKKRIFESAELKELLRPCDVSLAEIEAFLTELHAEEIDKLISINEEYDSTQETDHGQNLIAQTDYTNNIIPGLLSAVSSYADPDVVVTVISEGPEPLPGGYVGTLAYSLQLGPEAMSFGEWNWVLEGQLDFSFVNNGTGGLASFSHEYTSNDFDGHLLDATTPTVPPIPVVPVSLLESPTGKHLWLNFSATNDPFPQHELTFAPVTNAPLPIPVTPDETTIAFNHGASLALGNWMAQFGDGSLKMKAPLTCPEEVLSYVIDIGAGQQLELNWTLHRQTGTGTGSGGGSGGGWPGIGGRHQAITNFQLDRQTGPCTLTWASVEGTEYRVEASSDLIAWDVVGSNVLGLTGSTSFTDEQTAGFTERYYRVWRLAP